MSQAPVEEESSAGTEEEAELFDFSLLTPAEKKLLTPLPYRVGYWISQSDQTGGEKSDRAELATLEALITSYAQDMCKCEFMQRLMEDTIKHRENWSSWQSEIEKVPEECRSASLLLSDKLGENELAGFQENLLEIAVTVAGVFREETEHLSWPVRIIEILNDISDRAMRRTKDQFESPNISRKEKMALYKLKEMLGIQNAES